MADSFVITPAERGDVPLLRTLIHELAVFEKLAHEAVATDADLAEGLFGNRPSAEAWIARVGPDPAGFALYYTTFSTFVGRPGLYLEDLYVRPAFRGRGIGKALLVQGARLVRERNYGRLEWVVLKWNENAIQFYDALGAGPLDDWTTYRIAGDKLDALLEREGA